MSYMLLTKDLSIISSFLRKVMAILCLYSLSLPALALDVTGGLYNETGPGAADVVVAPTNFDRLDLLPYLDILEDPDLKLTFDTISSPQSATDFSPAVETGANFGFSRSAYWVRFTIKNDSKESRKFILRQDYPLIDYLDLWSVNEAGQWSRSETGDKRPFEQRPIEGRDFLFPITLPARSTQTFYLRYESQGSVNIGLWLYEPDHMLVASSTTQLLLGFFYGGFIALAVYNLLMFLVVKDKAFFSYFIYLISIGTYMSIHNGLAYQFLWPSNPWLANYGLVVFLGLTLFFALNFTRQLLDSEKTTPRANRMMLMVQVAVATCIALIAILPYHYLIIFISLLTASSISLVMYQGIVAYRMKHPASRYFLLAWSSLCLGVLLYELKSFGLIPHNAITQNGQQWGNWLEMIFLSLALSSRVNEIKRSTHIDPLTGTFNRRCFDDKLRGLFGRSRRTGRPLSLLVIDVDLFKAFNDEYGHAEGDRVLKHVSAIMSAVLPKEGILFRIGGEEFAILLPAASLTTATGIAEAIRHRVATTPIEDRYVTISIGVACAQPKRFSYSDQLFRAADKAMYQSKNRGRNRVTLADANDQQPLVLKAVTEEQKKRQAS